MGSYEENNLYKDPFFKTLVREKSPNKLKSGRPEPIMEPMGMYETLVGHDILEDDDLIKAFGELSEKHFQVYLKSMRLFGENIRLHIKNKTGD